jgi:large subunit ribosomal protein L13
MANSQKTYTPKEGEIVRQWRVIDASSKPLGRLASEIAGYLRGKHRPTFAEHMDTGDFVIVVNAARVQVTGNKLRQKMYYRHSGYPGGFKAVVLGDMLAKHPDRVVKHAVRGMLPHNALGRKMLRKLKIHAGPTHPHIGQIRASEKAAQSKQAASTAAPSMKEQTA